MVELFLLKAQKIIKNSYINIFSWVALGLAILSSCGYFVRSRAWEIHFFFPNIIYLILLIVNISPYILLVLYLKKFQNQLKATIIVPIIFGLLGLLKILSVIHYFEHYFEHYSGTYLDYVRYYFNRYFEHYLVHRFGYPSGIHVLPIVIDIAFIVFCVLSTISALKGLVKKGFVLISMGIGVLGAFISLVSTFPYVRNYAMSGAYIVLIGTFAEIFSTILLYIALGFFCIKCKIPAILTISPKKEKKTSENMSPEQELKLLKDKLELGMITEEEYHAQRADIISKL